MRSFHRALVGFNNLSIYFIFVIQFHCASMSKIHSRPSKQRIYLGVWEVVFFPVPDEVACSFFNILFDIFWPKNKFGLCIKIQRRGFGCLRLYFDLSKRVSLCSRQGLFCYTIAYSFPFGVIERVTKINFKYFKGNCNCSCCRVDQFHFYVYQPIKLWLFEKSIC